MLDQLQRSEGHRNEENKLSRDKRYQVSARGDGDLEEWGLGARPLIMKDVGKMMCGKR